MTTPQNKTRHTPTNPYPKSSLMAMWFDDWVRAGKESTERFIAAHTRELYTYSSNERGEYEAAKMALEAL